MTIDSDTVPAPAPLGGAAAAGSRRSRLGLLAVFLVYPDLTGSRDRPGVRAVRDRLRGRRRGRALGPRRARCWRRRAGARAPAIVLQLMLLPIGYYMIQGGLGWLGVPLIILGVAVCGLLVSPPTTRALGVG